MTRQNLPRTRPRRALASAVCATLVAAGAGAATVGAAAPAPAATPGAAQHTITPNPAYAGDPFEGWGNSLVWFANATGDYPDELREELFDLVFGEDGLNMNVARYNIGGGRASDVGDYFRQGAAVDGYWAHDTSTDPDSLYGTATTRFADHLALAQAWDPQDEASYDWTKDATQRWWLEKLAAEREDLVLEAFSNSPPWFLTRSGYSSGGASSTTEQVLTQYGAPAKFTAYLTKVVEHLEDTYDVRFQSVDPFNEPCTGYWSTPTGRLADGITPFTTAVKKPQEGAQICPGSGVGQQQSIIALLADDLAASSSDAVVSANDETNPQAFNNAWAQYDAATRADVDQINVHTYSDGGAAQSRDHALASGKGLWMSETGGNWVGAGFDPVNISGALGLAQKITSDLRTLQPDAYVLWQEVEDFYNMELGEKLNWGSIFIDFDCEYVDADGEVVDETDAIGFKSLRRVADALAAGDPVSSVDDCHIVTNSKYDAMRNFMQFITAGDRLIPTDDAASTAALDADGTGATVVHTNATLSARAVTLDLTRFGSIAAGASVTPYVTTQAADVDDTSTALVPGTPVPVGADGRATLTIPARSVVTFVVDGVSGVAPDANPLVDGASYQLVGVQSGKALAMSSAATLQIKDLATTSAALPAQTWVAHETTRYRAPSARRTFTLENVAGGTFLGATSEGTRFEAVTAAQAAESATTTWHLVTLDGTTWSFVNSATASALDVNGQSTADGASVGVYGSNDGGNQRWRVRATTATPSAPSILLRTTVGTPAPLPATVVPTYSWGAGVATPVTWGVPADAWDRAGTVTLTGTGTDIYGNAVVATAVVEVGDLVATDPASVTVVAGSSLDLVRGSAPATIQAQVGTSSARFTVPVTWDFTALTDASFATTGVVTVPGTVDAQAGTGGQAVPATLHVIVGAAAGTTNVALTSTPSASFTESTSYAVTRTINGDRGDKGWSNWKSGTKNETDTLTYTLAQPALLDEARIYFWKDGSSATWPTTVTTQYRDLATNQWTSLPAPVELPEQETAPTATIDLSGVSASAVRFVLTARPATHLIVAETEIDAAVPAASSVSTLARLSVDGIDVAGFEPGTTTYTAVGRGTAPRVVGVPTDASATVVTQRTGDVVTLTVTAVDGSSTVYTVTLDPAVGLTGVHVQGSPVAGAELTAAATVDPADAILAYQWSLDGVDVPGATGPTWTPGLDDIGSTVTVTVTASADGFDDTTSVSPGVVVLDGRAASSVALSASSSSVVEGSSLTLTARVTSQAASAVTGGTVQVRDGAAVVGSATVASDGTARVKVARPSVGTHAYSATFTPASSSATLVAPSTSATVTVKVTAKPVASTTTVRVTPTTPTTTARPVATVTVRASGASPSGTVTVTVKRGTTTVKTLTGRLSGGKVSVTLPTLSKPGTYTVTARYAGSSTVRASSASTTVTVKRATSTSLTAPRTVTTKANAVTTVTVTGTPSATVTGKVTVRVYRDGTQVAVRSATLSRSSAKVTLPKLAAGTYTVRATYAGTSTAAASTSRAVTVKVVR